MSLQWKIKPFEELSVHELYDLLRLRSEIFVVEQNCVYLDLDGKDKVATFNRIWWENSGARSSI
jgi:ElaA protein